MIIGKVRDLSGPHRAILEEMLKTTFRVLAYIRGQPRSQAREISAAKLKITAGRSPHVSLIGVKADGQRVSLGGGTTIALLEMK